MGAARRLVRSRLAAFVVCAGGVLLAVPSAGLAAGWTANPETVTGQQRRHERRHGPRQRVEPDRRLGGRRGDRDERANARRGASLGIREQRRARMPAQRPDFASRWRRQGRRDLDRRERQRLRGDRRREPGERPAASFRPADAAGSPQAAIVGGVADRVLDRGQRRSSRSRPRLVAGALAATPVERARSAPGRSPTSASSIAATERRCGLAPRRQRRRTRRHDRRLGTWTLTEHVAALRPPRLPSRSPRTAVDSPRSRGRSRRRACRSPSRAGWRVHAARPAQPTRRRASPPSRIASDGRCSSRRCRWHGHGRDPQRRTARGRRPTALASGRGSAPSVSADASGDVVVSVAGSHPACTMHASDATVRCSTLTSLAGVLTPGTTRGP